MDRQSHFPRGYNEGSFIRQFIQTRPDLACCILIAWSQNPLIVLPALPAKPDRSEKPTARSMRARICNKGRDGRNRLTVHLLSK